MNEGDVRTWSRFKARYVQETAPTSVDSGSKTERRST